MYVVNLRYQELSQLKYQRKKTAIQAEAKPKARPKAKPKAKPIEPTVPETQPITPEIIQPQPPIAVYYLALRKEYSNKLKERKTLLVEKLVSKAF